MKILQRITFTDENGKEHICHRVGRTEIVTITLPGISLENAMIQAVHKVSSDSSVHTGVKFSKAPKNDFYVLKTNSSFYFVKPLDSCSYKIVMDEYSGFEVSENCYFRAYIDGNITVFWMVDSNTHSRIGPYNYIVL